MAVKIRLSRHGKKNYAFFHIVVADSRAPRDGRFIEQIGTYNPNTNPATITLDSDRALVWLNYGAQPTDTCRRILSYKGVMLRKHLQGGVKKGALTQEQADAKFNAWMQEKEAKINAQKSRISAKKEADKKAAFEVETKFKETKAEAVAKKKAEEAQKAAEAAAAAAAENAEATAPEADAQPVENTEA